MSARYTGGLVYNAPGGWSGLFNGSSQYLSVASNAAFGMGTGDCTLECWYYPLNSTVSIQTLIDIRTTNTGVPVVIGVLSTGAPYAYNGTTYSGSVVANNSWNHIAFVRNGSGTNNCKLYLNGSQVAQFTDTADWGSTDTCAIGRNTAFAGEYAYGYISNARVVKGTAVYTAAFTPPNGPLQAITNTSLLTCRYPTFVDGSTNNFTITNNGTATANTPNPFPTSQLPNPALGGAGNGVYTMSQYAALKAANLWPAFDPFYKNVTLNLHGNGTNAAQNNTFLDSSTNAFTITRNGNTTQGTFTPYGANWSNYFPTASINTSSSGLIAGTNTFTLEFWIFPTAGTADDTIVDTRTSNGADATAWLVGLTGLSTGDGVLKWLLNGVGNASLGGTVPKNQWSHIAVTRNSSNVITGYVNGVATGTTQTDSRNLTNTNFLVGGNVTTPTGTWYLSNVRWVVGSVVYSSNFTPSTTPLTAITNTKLLTCQSNRYVDNSSNGYTFTTTGSPSVQRFSPFSPTTAYSTSVIGGSMYLDGTTDFVKTPSDVNLSSTLLASNFTIECWIYLAAYPSSGAAIWTNSVTNADGFTSSYINANGTVGTGKVNVNEFNTVTTIKLNTWTHFAIVRNSGTLYVYFNGVQDATTGAASTYLNTTATKPMQIGSSNQSPPTAMQGYMSDFRVVASAVYTTGFTPNTAPLTAISGTNLLLSTTNAGILDNAMMNDLETVGNAQISTSVKKYGTGSLAFDGTGDYLAEPTNLNFGYGSGNFTIEFWLYLNATSAQSIVSNLTSTASVNPHIYYSPTNGITYYVASVDRIIGGALSTSTWYHIALSRSSTSTKLFVNGAQVGSTYTDSNNYGTTAPLAVATYWESGTPSTVNTLNGYIDDLRITKGVARYTTNFTPPTSQVQDQ